jgi:hypothetical protein
MPESPRWLVEKGRYDEALAVLKTVRSEDRALAEFAQVEQVTEDEKKGNQLSFKEILSNKWLRRIVFVGIGVSVTQQLTGINSIMYYGSRVLEEPAHGGKSPDRQYRLRSGGRHRGIRAAQHGPDGPPQDVLHWPVPDHDLPLPHGYRRNAAPGGTPRVRT